MLAKTPPDKLVDQRGRPYFLWDVEMTLEEFQSRLRHPNDVEAKAYLVGKLMRQAKPDDVFSFVSLEEMRELWPRLERYLGEKRPFWRWLLDAWGQRA
ncbi:MAG: hypothetical protein AB2A00_16180 [Myxococcota bacterium]